MLTLVAPVSAREWAVFCRDGSETRDATPLTYRRLRELSRDDEQGA